MKTLRGSPGSRCVLRRWRRLPRRLRRGRSACIVVGWHGRDRRWRAATSTTPGAVAIDGTTIVAVGPAADIAARFKAAEQIDAAGSIVIPGLINAHAHAPMVLYRGLADDLRLQEWLEKYIFPAEAKTVSREMVRAGTRLAALEMIQSGTTVYADMYYFEEEIARDDEGRGHARRARPDDHPVSGARREDAAGRAGAHRSVHQGVREGRPHRSGRRAAFALHARCQRPAGVARAGDEIRRARADSRRRDGNGARELARRRIRA